MDVSRGVDAGLRVRVRGGPLRGIEHIFYLFFQGFKFMLQILYFCFKDHNVICPQKTVNTQAHTFTCPSTVTRAEAHLGQCHLFPARPHNSPWPRCSSPLQCQALTEEGFTTRQILSTPSGPCVSSVGSCSTLVELALHSQPLLGPS